MVAIYLCIAVCLFNPLNVEMSDYRSSLKSTESPPSKSSDTSFEMNHHGTNRPKQGVLDGLHTFRAETFIQDNEVKHPVTGVGSSTDFSQFQSAARYSPEFEVKRVRRAHELDDENGPSGLDEMGANHSSQRALKNQVMASSIQLVTHSNNPQDTISVYSSSHGTISSHADQWKNVMAQTTTKLSWMTSSIKTLSKTPTPTTNKDNHTRTHSEIKILQSSTEGKSISRLYYVETSATAAIPISKLDKTVKATKPATLGTYLNTGNLASLVIKTFSHDVLISKYEIYTSVISSTGSLIHTSTAEQSRNTTSVNSSFQASTLAQHIGNQEFHSVERSARNQSYTMFTDKNVQGLSTTLNPTAKISSNNAAIRLTCSNSRSCKDKCQRERHIGQTKTIYAKCFCDPFCEKFGDCCEDYAEQCASINLAVTGSFGEYWQMEPLREIIDNTHLGIWMISNCPRSWPKDVVRSKCMVSSYAVLPDYRDNIPVTSSNGTTFKNRYCAECHGVTLQELTDYDLHESCFVGQRDLRKCSHQTGKVSCSPLLWKPLHGSFRRYFIRLTKTCRAGLPDLREKCTNGGVGIVSGFDRTGVKNNYKNLFCAQCNQATLLECGPVITFRASGVGKGFSLIFKPKKASSPKQSIKTRAQCSEGQVFDKALKTCRPAVTRQAMTPCLIRYRVLLWLKPKDRNFTMSARPAEDQHIKESLESIFDIQPFNLFNVHMQANKNYTTVVFDLDWSCERSQEETNPNLQMVLNFSRSFSMEISNHTFIVYKSSTRLLVCERYEEFTASEYTFLPSAHPAIYVSNSHEIFHKYQYYANETKWENCQEHPVGNISVCTLFLPANCTAGFYVALDRHEYTIFSNGTLHRIISKETFKIGTYEVKNKTAWICTNYSSDFEQEEKQRGKSLNDLILMILTQVGLSLSVVCLIVTLITYYLFAELRTLPGINLMNLCVSLLFQQSLYFLTGQTENRVGCSVVAALTHYFILTSFAWMSIIAFATWRTLRVIRIPLQGSAAVRLKRRRVMSYMALGWLLPLAFIVTSVALHLSEVLVVGYGGPSGCLISNNLANIVLLYSPIAFSIVCNAVMFVLAAVGLYKRKREVLTVLNEARKRTFPVIVRMAVLTGFTWIFGFLGMLVSEYFFYPFTVLNTLQGVYIAAAFVFKRRVVQLYKKRLRPKNKNGNPKIEVRQVQKLGVTVETNEGFDTGL